MSSNVEGREIYNQTIKLFGSHPEPKFESPGQQESVWGRPWGCDKMSLNGGGIHCSTSPLIRDAVN